MDFALRLLLPLFMITRIGVSILVLMDFALRHAYEHGRDIVDRCFNPCFDGFCIATSRFWSDKYDLGGFNPCFDGFCIATFI